MVTTHTTTASTDEAMPDAPSVAVPEVKAVLPVIEETLLVEKRKVDGGGFRLTKTVDRRTEVVDEPLERSQVAVERRAVDRLLEPGETPVVRQEGDTTVYPVVKEVAIVQKRLMLVEEVRVTTSRSTFRQPRTVTLRSEDVSVERMAAASIPPAE